MSGCIGGRMRYEPVSFALPPATQEAHAAYVREIVGGLSRGRHASVSIREDAGLRPIASLDELFTLPLPATHAAFACSSRWMRGAEVDLIVDAPEGPTLVTVWQSTTGDLVIGVGGEPPSFSAPAGMTDPQAWGEKLAMQQGLGGFEEVDQAWTAREVDAVREGLEVLTPEERHRLSGIVLGRMTASPRAPRSELALFDGTELPGRIDFFDLTFGQFGHGFVGALDAPYPTPVMTVVHEFAHAIADYPMRHAYQQYSETFQAHQDSPSPDPTQQETIAAAFANYLSIKRADPVIRTYRRIRGRKRGPTSYGWNRPHESFAEAFALYKLDPAALARLMPEVHDWFAAGGHLPD